MTHRTLALLLLITIVSCNQRAPIAEDVVTVNDTEEQTIVDETSVEEESEEDETVEITEQDLYFLYDRLPDWVNEANVLDGLNVGDAHEFDNRMNPLYLEADFNGDDQMDVAIPIKEINGDRRGIAVIHGGNNEVFILGAGGFSENGIGEDLYWCDLWKINRERVNAPGIDATEDLILENPSIQIEKSEVGGGQIYWNGEEYAYFHQTC